MSETIAKLAAELVAKMTTPPNAEFIKVSDADILARPLIEQLKAEGHIPADHIASVEWQGVHEFGIVPISHMRDHDCTTPEGLKAFMDEPTHWTQIERDGSIGVYA